MSKHSNNEIEVFGLSFLDLISCAMAGILVLYVTTEEGPIRTADKRPPKALTIDFPDTLNGAAVKVVFTNDSKRYEGFSDGHKTSKWTFGVNPITASMQLEEKIVDPKISISIVDFNPAVIDTAPLINSVSCRVTLLDPESSQINKPKKLLLTEANFFYATEPLN